MKAGLALRSTVFSPSSVARARIAPLLEKSMVDSVWFPSVGQAFDPLDMCGITLGESRRLRVGTGVIRSTDYEASRLLARVHTLSEGSGGRMLRAAYLYAEGAILNFCPPDYVQRIVPNDVRTEGFTLACYVKLFFSENDAVAKRMLVDEMKMYDGIPQYHAMFEEIGVSDAIRNLDAESAQGISDDLLEISAANPSDDEVSGILERFGRSGVDLPIVYPYISGGSEYKGAVVERLASIIG